MIKGHERADIKSRFASRTTTVGADKSEDALNASIDLVVRLVTMLDVGELRHAFSGRVRLAWTDGPLKNFVSEVFPSTPKLGHEGVKFGVSFNAHSLGSIAGLKVELTTNLADHLRFRGEDRAVTIFHHVSFLKCQQDNEIFPPGFVAETIGTIALLFPRNHRKVQRWYRAQDDPDELDPLIFACGEPQKQIEQYEYWHDRLVILKGEFDDCPSTLSRLWNDRREGVHWYTLWVAIGLTVFFGLVQSVEGALQVYKSW